MTLRLVSVSQQKLGAAKLAEHFLDRRFVVRKYRPTTGSSKLRRMLVLRSRASKNANDFSTIASARAPAHLSASYSNPVPASSAARKALFCKGAVLPAWELRPEAPDQKKRTRLEKANVVGLRLVVEAAGIKRASETIRPLLWGTSMATSPKRP
jgi:hypothetical protein